MLWDCFPDEQRLGGAPANFARHAHQLGMASYAISCIGADPLGQNAKDELEASGLKTDFLFEHASLPTGTVQITLDSKGTPEYHVCENVAWDAIPCPEELIRFVGRLDAICFGTLSQRSVQSRETVRQVMQTVPEDALKILDVNFRAPFFSKEITTPSLELANVLKLSDEELPVLADYYDLKGEETQQLQQLIPKFGLRLIAYTKGAAGSLLVTPGEVDVAPAVSVKMVDSVGAGDSFTAALCTGLLHGFTLGDCNRFANQVAAFVCSQRGACPKLSDELLNVLQNHSNGPT